MSRIRSIKPELFQDAITAGLSNAAFRLFVGMISLADDEGRLRADPGFLHAQVFWNAFENSRESVARAREELRSSRAEDCEPLIVVYRVKGQEYAYIRGFLTHQRIDHPSKSRLPAPDANSELLAKAREPSRSLAPDRDLGSGSRIEDLGSISSGSHSDPDHPTLADEVDDPPGGELIDLDAEREIRDDPRGEKLAFPGVVDVRALAAKAPKSDRANIGALATQVFDHWIRVMNKRSGTLFDAKRRAKVEKTLRAGYTVDQICTAIDGCKRSPFHQGDNGEGAKHDDLELICRDSVHTDRFIELASATVKGRFGPTAAELRPMGDGTPSKRMTAVLERAREMDANAARERAERDAGKKVEP